ncbi:acyl-CoA dehydrogenase family protein [Myxococcota bacterium]|nr:acyl-CoA dehydrogenase family protein [Myxococcota bacterium]
MHFELSDDDKMIQESVRRFVDTEVKPHAGAWDKKGELPLPAVRGLAELGLMGMFIPGELGGAGLGMTAGAVAIEEIARHDGSLALTVASHNSLCLGHLMIAANDAQKARWVPALASGEKLGAWGLTEAESGSDSASLRTTATRDGDRWILNGSKNFITQGSLGEVFVIIARTDPHAPKKSEGLSAFVLEKGMKGFSQRPIHGKLGMRASDTAELSFDHVEVPAENLIGVEGQAFRDVVKVLERGRIGIGALGVGIARGALEEARAYALDRKQFNKPIADFQAIQWMLADIATEVDAARLLVHRAAYLADAKEPLGAAPAQAKLFASEAAVRASMKAIQIFGGYGYTREFPVERYLRDAKLLEIGEGTSEIQRMVIARNVLGR